MPLLPFVVSCTIRCHLQRHSLPLRSLRPLAMATVAHLTLLGDATHRVLGEHSRRTLGQVGGSGCLLMLHESLCHLSYDLLLSGLGHFSGCLNLGGQFIGQGHLS